MNLLKFRGDSDKAGQPILIDEKGNEYVLYNGLPHFIGEKGVPLRPVAEYKLLLDTFTNIKKSRLIFYTYHKNPYSIIVLDETMQMERSYRLGSYQYLSIDGMEQGIPTLIKSFEQVILAWKNNRIYF